MSEGLLSIVATPIGNVGDLSSRAIETLTEADLVACEDTRHTGILFKRLEIQAKFLSLHAHSEASRIPTILDLLREGKHVALVSDAGYPGISDPGQRLVHATMAAGLEHTVIPGPSAVVTALAGSGIPAAAFTFEGFLPHKKGKRRKMLEAALDRPHPTVFFESPHRIVSSLEILTELAPERLATLARELTKKFEEYRRLPAQELLESCQKKAPKGEICLIVSGNDLPKWFLNEGDEKEPDPYKNLPV